MSRKKSVRSFKHEIPSCIPKRGLDFRPGLIRCGFRMSRGSPSVGCGEAYLLSQAWSLPTRSLPRSKSSRLGSTPFPQEQQAVGNIDFNQDLLTQVFTQYQGRIINAFAKVGDTVKKDQPLFTIESTDLLQAESTLISAAGVLELTTKNLERQRNLFRQSAAAQKDYEQSISDQQAAEAAYRAARGAVMVFGKTEAEIDRIVNDRKVDATLTVSSPITGLVTARNAAPGLFVQPGNPPPVYIVADTSIMWMIANVPERDAAELKLGQEVTSQCLSLPGPFLPGKIVTIGPNVDPNTRRVFVRSEIADPDYELRAGMFATFVITLAPPKKALAVPQDAIVREGDGSMTVWTTEDGHNFFQRMIKTGLSYDGFTEVARRAETRRARRRRTARFSLPTNTPMPATE